MVLPFCRLLIEETELYKYMDDPQGLINLMKKLQLDYKSCYRSKERSLLSTFAETAADAINSVCKLTNVYWQSRITLTLEIYM